jgi:hypothetical protein
VANNALPVEAQKLARFPALRVVEKRRTAFSTKQNENIIAAIGQCVGVALPAGQECDLCASKPNTRHFSGGCVVAPADAQSKYTACFNCVYYWKYKQCSQHQK